MTKKSTFDQKSTLGKNNAFECAIPVINLEMKCHDWMEKTNFALDLNNALCTDETCNALRWMEPTTIQSFRVTYEWCNDDMHYDDMYCHSIWMYELQPDKQMQWPFKRLNLVTKCNDQNDHHINVEWASHWSKNLDGSKTLKARRKKPWFTKVVPNILDDFGNTPLGKQSYKP